jgi:hypothetical protein
MRRIGWIVAALLVAVPRAGGQAWAQSLSGRPQGQQGYNSHGRQPGREYRHNGYVERQGSTQRYYDRRGEYEGRSERMAGSGVRRFYDEDGRYLGREDIQRDFRQRRW